jgi:serine/threonine protein kinase
MQLTIKNKIGDGAFADVYTASDEMDRQVAVKIVRPGDVHSGNALAHARALAKVRHPNVVVVHSVERVPDPEDPTTLIDCVVMELLEGQTLGDRLKGPSLSVEQATSIGLGILAGVAAIHDAGIAHGDLHTENVMVKDGDPKLIDLLYLTGSGTLSSSTLKDRTQGDLRMLRVMLLELAAATKIDPSQITALNQLIGSVPTLDDIAKAFATAMTPGVQADKARLVQQALVQLQDSGFAEGLEYAKALLEETPREVLPDILEELISKSGCDTKHRAFVHLAWKALTEPEKQRVATFLSIAIDSATPGGQWAPLLKFLNAIGQEGWQN